MENNPEPWISFEHWISRAPSVQDYLEKVAQSYLDKEGSLKSLTVGDSLEEDFPPLLDEHWLVDLYRTNALEHPQIKVKWPLWTRVYVFFLLLKFDFIRRKEKFKEFILRVRG